MGMVGYFEQDAGETDALLALVKRELDLGALQFADKVIHKVPLYQMSELGDALTSPNARQTLMAEWAWILREASGVLVLKAALADTSIIDRVTRVFEEIILRERSGQNGGADHFAAAGANDRIWNAAQKLCLTDPQAFALYHANPTIDAICEAWLGPFYQLTAQVNVVRPGGAAQTVHCDYHLGFQSAETSAKFPAHSHAISPALTLQGAIAHCDMPLESGPTRLLPFSQLFAPGYLAYHRSAFAELFEDHAVQVPLEKGDAIFFNPALMHAAGANKTSDTRRIANLLQVSSAFGRAMESLDRTAMCKALYPALHSLFTDGELDQSGCNAAIAASAEGYSFPTNLDSDPPKNGLAPETQAALLLRALASGMTPQEVSAQLDAMAMRRAP